MFKATVEKLEKGWDVIVSAPTYEAAQAIVAERHSAHLGDEDKPSFRATVKRLKDETYRVTFYQSTLTEAQETIRGLFKSARRESSPVA